MDEWAGAESWPAVYDEDAPRGSVTDQAAVHLRLARPLSVDREHARELLAAAEIPWLGPRVDYAVGDAGNRRFETNLRLPLRDTASGIVLHKAAYLDLGPAEPAPAATSGRSAGARPPSPRSFRSSRASLSSRPGSSYSRATTHHRAASSG
jgi:hypothetical protein